MGVSPYAPTSDLVVVFVGAHGGAPCVIRCRGVIHHARMHSEEGRNELRPYKEPSPHRGKGLG